MPTTTVYPATRLRPAPCGTRHFTWSAEGRMLVAEMSSLPINDFERVWNDACDVGLTLISHRTGTEVVCTMEREILDGEGDVGGWVFVPVGRDHAGQFEVHVLND
jgi:hypothetical protein